MKQRLIMLGLVSLALSATAQHRIDTLHGLVRSFYFPEQDLVFRSFEDGFILTSPDESAKTYHRKPRGWSMERAISEVFMVGDDPILVELDTKSVYRVSGDSLQLRDKISHPRMTITPWLIKHRSTLYYYGGYGLWSVRKTLLNLDPTEHRWNPVIINEDSESLPPGLFNPMMFSEGDYLFLLYGEVVDYADPLKTPANAGVWSFHTGTRTWSNLGNLNPAIFPERQNVFQSFSMGDTTFILQDARIIALHGLENKAVLYQHTVFSQEAMKGDKFMLKSFFRNGKVYYYRELGGLEYPTPLPERAYEYSSIPISRFLGKELGTQEFYVRETSLFDLWPWGLGLILAGGTVQAFRILRRRGNQAELTDNGIRFRGELHELEQVPLAILKKMMETPGPVFSTDLMAIIQNPNLKYAHNNRVKNEVIRQLNAQLRSIFNCRQDVITSTASDQDKRFRWYKLDKNWFRAS